jgi:hypothetical protein
MTAPTALVFVYNAKPGVMAGLMDTIHKTLSPDTYACDLCAVTYGAFSMRPEWRDWLKAQPWQTEFAYRDAFRAAHPALADTPLPAIFIRSGTSGLSELVSAQDIHAAKTIPDLIAKIEAALAIC